MATAKKVVTKNTTKTNYQSKKELKDNENYCTKCRRILALSNFWTSDSIADGNGLQHICVNCANDIFNEIYRKRHYKDDGYVVDSNNIIFDTETEETFREACSYLDIAFKYDAYEQTKSHIESCKSSNRKINKILGVYKSKLSSTSNKNSGRVEKLVFANSDKSRIIEDVRQHMYDGFEADEEMIKFWGKDKKEELEFLESEWANLTTRFECDTYTTEMLFQEIALTRLDIRNKRANGVNVDKELKTLQDLLGSANIKPVQDTNSSVNEQVSFGTLIKKYENTKPINEPEDEFKDPDGIKNYISIWFLGHLCKMLGINNDYSKLYEDEMAKYRVEIDESETDDEEDIDLSSIIKNSSGNTNE